MAEIKQEKRVKFALVCPACAAKRRHTAEDWENHPLAGTGHYDDAGQPKATGEKA